MKNTLNYLNTLKKQGAKRVKIENILILLESDKKRSEQLFCGTCNKFEVCKDLCKETDPCCKIYKAK